MRAKKKGKFPEGFEGNFQGQFLQHHTASGVPKRKAKRQVKLADGPVTVRYDPSSPK